MSDWSRMFPSVPAWLALLGIGFELFRLATRRSERLRHHPVPRFTSWALRPWLVWAVFNLVYRWQWDRGFNTRQTFPFYANPWVRGETFQEALRRIWTSTGFLTWTVVSVALLAMIVLLLAWVWRGRSWRASAALAALFPLAIGLHLSIANLPSADWSNATRTSSLLSPWNVIGSTMLFTVPHVRGTDDYLRRFLEIQPRLKETIHGLSHPPVASLSLYWIGKAMGVKGQSIRQADVRLRYTIGLTAFGALNVLAIFLLGRSLFGAKTGFLAAVLWTTAPAVVSYATFAQDSLYAVFFNLALWLGWQTATAERRAEIWGILLGVSFFAMITLCYSWCLVTTIFALFAIATGLRRGWRWLDYGRRLILPLGVMTLLAAGFLAYYRLDYWAMYQCSSEYVRRWYPFTGPYQWIMALLGGQIDLWLLLGSVTCSALASSLAAWRRASFREDRVIYLSIILAVFALPILFGPNCLKMEAARCWIWVASVPLAFAARRLESMPGRLFLYGALAVAGMTSLVLRLFLNFGT